MFRFQGGSFGTRRWQGDLSGGGGGLSYAFSLGGNGTDGILSYNNEYRQTTASGRVQAQLDAATDAALALRYHDGRFHYPTDGAGQLVDRNAYSFGDALSVGIDAGRRWTDALETRLFLRVWEADNGTDDQPDSPADSVGFFGFKSLTDTRRITGGGRAVWRAAAGTALIAGYEEERQSVRGFNQSFSEFGESGGSAEREWRNRAFHAQLSWARDAVAVDVGGRAEDNDRFGAAATWRAGGVWRPGANTRLRVSAGSGIKEPTFLETYATGFVTGNPDLAPERSTSVEGGIDHAVGGAATLSLTWFRQDYQDLIQYTGTPPAPGEPNFFNVARARSRGLEAEGTVEAGPVRLRGTYTYLDTAVRDAGFDEGPGATFVEGAALLRRPRHTVAATAFIRATSRVGVDVAARRVGAREDRDFSSFPRDGGDPARVHRRRPRRQLRGFRGRRASRAHAHRAGREPPRHRLRGGVGLRGAGSGAVRRRSRLPRGRRRAGRRRARRLMRSPGRRGCGAPGIPRSQADRHGREGPRDART